MLLPKKVRESKPKRMLLPKKVTEPKKTQHKRNIDKYEPFLVGKNKRAKKCKGRIVFEGYIGDNPPYFGKQPREKQEEKGSNHLKVLCRVRNPYSFLQAGITHISFLIEDMKAIKRSIHFYHRWRKRKYEEKASYLHVYKLSNLLLVGSFKGKPYVVKEKSVFVNQYTFLFLGLLLTIEEGKVTEGKVQAQEAKKQQVISYLDGKTSSNDLSSLFFEVKDRVRIEDVISRYVFFERHRRQATNLRAVCPFHKQGKERRPSLIVNRRHNRYKCFACNMSGDVIDFVRDKHSITDRDALIWVRDNYVPSIDLKPKKRLNPNHSLVSLEVLVRTTNPYMNLPCMKNALRDARYQ